MLGIHYWHISDHRVWLGSKPGLAEALPVQPNSHGHEGGKEIPCGVFSFWPCFLRRIRVNCFVKVPDKMHVVVKILLKALANLPHTDFVLCKCLLSQVTVFFEEHICSSLPFEGGAGRAAGEDIALPCWPARDVSVQGLLAADSRTGELGKVDKVLAFWTQADLVTSVEGFEDAIRKFVCHVICITYQVSVITIRIIINTQ